MKLLKNLYQYRELLKTNVKKEIRGKYKGSFLGILWSFLNPLLMTVVYAVVFKYIMKQQIENFLVFLVIGIIPWNFFITAMNQGMIVIRMNSGIVNKVYFPREILPISVALSGLVNFFISCIVILLFCLFSTVGISWHIVWLPLIAIIQFVLTLGLIFALSAINIYIKDTEYLVQFFLNMLFYATPILYMVSFFPEKFRWILYMNPLTHLVEAYRNIFFYHKLPAFDSLILVGVIAIVTYGIGLLIFRRLERGFAEEI